MNLHIQENSLSIHHHLRLNHRKDCRNHCLHSTKGMRLQKRRGSSRQVERHVCGDEDDLSIAYSNFYG